jgi:hypothetical protein
MQITFPRLADYARGYAVVARDDGVVYRLNGGVCSPALPHDLVRLITEQELGITDGIWAGIAAGAVFSGMVHLSGRRPPHAADRSRQLMRDFRQAGLSELMSATRAKRCPVTSLPSFWLRLTPAVPGGMPDQPAQDRAEMIE